MIIRAITAKGSSAGLQYQANEKKSKYSKVYNLSSENPKENYIEMRAVADMNKKIEKPFSYHVISPSKEANQSLSDIDYKEIAEKYAKEMNFSENQWRFDVHKNTDDVHIHIVSNRINFQGKNTVKSARIGMRAGKIADELAKEKGLKTAKEIANYKKTKIAEALNKSLTQSKSWEEVKAKMKVRGYHLELNYNKNGINGARIVPLADIKNELSAREKYAKKGYKLSDINRNLKIKNLDKQIQINRESRRNIKSTLGKGTGLSY